MFRTSVNISQLLRVSSRRNPPRVLQSSYSGGGRGGGKVWLLLGTLTAAAGGTAVYAKYDPNFRKLIEENIPYSSSVLDVSTQWIDAIVGSSNETELSPPPPPAINKQQSPTIMQSPVKPAEDVNFQKKQRELEAKALKQLIQLKVVADASTLKAITAFKEASQHIKDLSLDMSKEANNDAEGIALILSKNVRSETLLLNASNAAAQARAELGAVKMVLDSGIISNEESKKTRSSIIKAETDLEQAQHALNAAQLALKPSNSLQQQIQQAHQKIESELGVKWDSFKNDEHDIYALRVAMKIIDYSNKINKQTEAEQKVLVDNIGEDALEDRVQAHLASKEDDFKKELSKEYETQLIIERDEANRRAQSQLQQQAIILNEEKTSALLHQRTAFSRELSERMGHQLQQHTKQVATAIEALKGADNNLRQLLERIEEGADLLSMSRSCDALVRSLDINPFPALDWTHQRRAIEGHLRDVKLAFKAKNHQQFLTLALAMLPDKVVANGVYTEPALRSRFYDVEKVARRVAMIGDDEKPTLGAYILSYLRSAFLLIPVQAIRPQEIANESLDFSQLDNNAVLDRAKYFMDQGDLLQTVRFMNLLVGPCQFVASGWLNDATSLLEVQQIARTLAAYASLLVQQTAITSKH